MMMHRIICMIFAFRNSSVFRNSQIDSLVKFRILSYALTNWAVVEFCRSGFFSVGSGPVL